MAIGTVKWFDPYRGYGFIEPTVGADYAFVHQNAVHTSGLRTLVPGQRVEYDLVPGMDGKPAARNILVLNKIE